ncbi:phosphatase PAP2 family protein [Nocardioides sp. MAHUQ-72]|uniref:phosphatase PAP2 family protein n=1 Tax=unclassified Nocardioides TaxID=2615069 RepID=UPI003611CCF8
MASSSSISRTRPQPAPEPTRDDLRQVRWAAGIWVLVAVFAVVTAVWSHHVGVPLRDPDGKMFRGRLTSALVLFAGLVLLEAVVRTVRERQPWRRFVATLRSRWTVRRLALAVTGLVAYHAVYICYRNLKSWDAFNTVRDEQMLRFDRWMFLGHDPAALLHDVFGQDTAAYVLMVVYKSFTYLVPLSVVAALVFTPRIREGYVFLASAMWVWVLGVGSYYLIPTLGPFASAPHVFAALPHTGITSTQAEYMAERAQMLADPAAPDSFVSISAFASLHVGFTCMVLFMLLYYRRRRLALAMTAYLLAVMVATVYFGWHFVVDDIAGVALAALAVLLGRFTVYPTGRPD